MELFPNKMVVTKWFAALNWLRVRTALRTTAPAGAGYTKSMFVDTLALADPTHQASVHLGAL